MTRKASKGTLVIKGILRKLGSLQKERGKQDTQDIEKTEVLNDFASDITASAPAMPPTSHELQNSMEPD